MRSRFSDFLVPVGKPYQRRFHDRTHRQRQEAQRRRRAGDAPLVGVARRARREGPEIRLRHRAVRGVHRAPGRRAGALVLGARVRRRRPESADHRRAGAARPAPPGAEGVDRSRSAAVRLLPVGADHGGGRPARKESRPQRQGHRRGDDQPLPLRNLCAHSHGDPRRGEDLEVDEGIGATMAETFARKFEPARRKFLKQSAAIGGGLSVGFGLPGALAQKADGATEINAWVVIRPDDAIIIRYARSEMGQGSMTSAPMLVAEELECDWTRVKVEYASANANVKRKRVWGDMAAVGSRTIRNSQEYLRKAGATAREMLTAAAAQEWRVPASECSASNSFITHGAGGRRVSFGKVADAAAKLEPPKDVKLKDPKDWKLIGKSVKRVDIPDTVIGRQRYGIDVQLPGMLYAAIAQCPVFGGKVKSMDASKVEGRRGIVKVVPLETFVAVVADNWWRAKEALHDVHIEWDVGANGNVSSASLMEFYKGGLDAQTDVATARKDGDFDQAFASAAKKIEAEYYTPYLAHACLEPMGCTAIVKDGKVDVWTSTQNAEASLANAAATAGVPLENVEVHRVQLGGGFGRRGGAQDFVRQGVAIAKAMEGTPVKMLWTREEDTQHDFYRPASLIRIKAGLDDSGNPVAWYSRVAATSIFETLARVPLKRPFAPADGVDPQAVASLHDLPHAIPNVRIEYAQRTAHVPVGFWRTVGRCGRKGPLRIPPCAARKIAERPRHSRSHGESRGLGPASCGRRVPRHRA